MQWTMFQQTLTEIDRRWLELRKELQTDFPEYKDYIKKCELVFSFNRHSGSNPPLLAARKFIKTQFEFKKNIAVHDLQHYLPLLQTSAMKDGLAALFDLLKKAIEEKAKNSDQKQDGSFEKKLKEVRADIDYFPVECLEIIDDFSVELVFPTLAFDLIQAVKTHRLVNQEKTCQCTACIKVYLY